MATAAERQRAYRQRHLKDEAGSGERLSMVISVSAKAKLGRLARHYGMTKRQVIEKLLGDAESSAGNAPGYYD
jgi:macrodomain Ter protein organizer (MatP/YcbG family)